MGCEKNTIQAFTGIDWSNKSNVPVHEKILRPGNMWRKSNKNVD